MSKGLEALKRSFDSWEYLKDYETIEKELKALEIIKNKEVDIKAFNDLTNLGDYNYYCEPELTQEEYDLLKEILL